MKKPVKQAFLDKKKRGTTEDDVPLVTVWDRKTKPTRKGAGLRFC
jgi:hypothetical protein